MSKKIIALALTLICIATVFTACQQKLDLYKINGVDVAVVTDADGKAIVDESNRIAAIVTDREGEVQTHLNGEPQTYWATVQNSFVADHTLYASNYVMEGLDGWEFNAIGGMEKKKTNGQCKIQCAMVIEEGYVDKSLDEYLKMRDDRNAEALALYEKEGYKVTVEKKAVELTEKKIPMIHYTEIIYNKDGSIANYSESLYFEYKGTEKYNIHFTSTNGVGLDKDFNFIEFVNTNFHLREIKEEDTTATTPTEAPTQAK